MGNDAVCKTVGIGNIRMRTFDGHVRTLTNVRHVSNLKKNLLSLGGYKFSGADEGIKVTKGSMMTLKGERTANLYKLTGSIIIVMLQQQQRRRILQDFGTCVLDT